MLYSRWCGFFIFIFFAKVQICQTTDSKSINVNFAYRLFQQAKLCQDGACFLSVGAVSWWEYQASVGTTQSLFSHQEPYVEAVEQTAGFNKLNQSKIFENIVIFLLGNG